MTQVFRFIGELGMWSIALAIGSVLAGGVAFGLWEKRHERRQFLIGLVPALFVFAMGLVFVAAAFGGMHERHGWPGVFAIAVALVTLFAVVLVPAGRAVAEIEQAEEEIEPPPPAVQAEPPIVLRGTRARLLAAAPALYLALAFGMAQAGHHLPWLDKKQLGLILAVQFLALHSFALLALFVALRFSNWRAEALRWYFIACLLCFYVASALSESVDAAIQFLIAAFATYGGLLGRARAADAVAQVAKRWAVAFALFFAAAIALRMPEVVMRWHLSPRGMYFGLGYFLALAAAELYALYDRSWIPRRGRTPA